MLGNIIVALVVILATVISIRKIYKTLTGKTTCSCGCGSSNGNISSCCNSDCHSKIK